MEISVKIRMAKKMRAVNVSCVMNGEFHFSSSSVSHTRLTNFWTFFKGCVINLYFFAVNKEFKNQNTSSKVM